MRRFNDILWVGILVLLTHVAQADSLEAMRAQGLQCVEPTDIMRKQHMEFLLHQRDLTVWQGIRTKKHSLNQCVECHVQSNSEGEFISINAPEQFCSACHEYASVNMDCFDCHATKPDLPQSANALIQQALGQLIVKQLNSEQSDFISQ